MVICIAGHKCNRTTPPRLGRIAAQNMSMSVDEVSEQVKSRRNIAPFITPFINVENQMIRKVMVSVAVMASALLSHAAVADENAVKRVVCRVARQFDGAQCRPRF